MKSEVSLPLLRHIASLAVASFFCSMATAQYSTTNLQLVYGSQFHDPYYGYNTESGDVTSLMLEHYSTWKYGDNYIFVEGFYGEFLDFVNMPTGDKIIGYSEGTTRLSLSKLFNKNLECSAFSDVYFAAGYEQGNDFNASLIGLSVDVPARGFNALNLSFFVRDDNLNAPHEQLSVCWLYPFKIGDTNCALNGYFEFAQTDIDGMDINGQPQFLVDLSKLAGTQPGEFEAGIEWYYHKNKNFEASFPTLVLKWTLH